MPEERRGEKIKAANVAVVFTYIKVIDAMGRRSVETRGTGESIIFREGQMKRGTWRKEGRDGRLRFYDEKLNEISFAPGTAWIEVVPKGTAVSASAE